MAEDRTRTKVGFIGLGSQGGPMARRIVDAGFPTLLWARRQEALAPYADTEAIAAPTIEDLGARCDHVGVCVVDDVGTKQVCAVLIASMRPGSRIAVHSTVHPDTCRALAAEAASRGIGLVDAPVSGGGPGAAAGTLTVMVGGDAATVAAAQPVFESFAGLIVHLGDVGAGQSAKLINNSLMAAHVALAHHALTAGTSLGLDRPALISLIKASSGRSFGFEVYARLPNPGAFAHGAKLLDKDVRLLGELLAEHPSFAPFGDLAEPILAALMAPPLPATAGKPE